jgi:hypothetical protein
VSSKPDKKALVDELAGLEKKLTAARAAMLDDLARADTLQTTILGWYEKRDASSTFVAEGEKASYLVSARSLKRTVLYDQAVKLLGKELLLKIATIQLGALQKAAGKKYALCVTSAGTGPRSLTLVA